jgi:hypothetical protein
MRSTRSSKGFFLQLALTVAAVAAWQCVSACKPGPAYTTATNHDFKDELKIFRNKLNGHNLNSSVDVNSPNTIVIGLETNSGKSNFVYMPSEMRIKAGQTPTLSWISWEGNFTLTFRPVPPSQPSPLANGKTVVTGTTTVPSVASEQVTGMTTGGGSACPTPPCRYHFTVHLDLPGGGTADDPECPPIIIE